MTSKMKCVQILMEEHQLILRAMQVTNNMAQSFFDNKKIDLDDLNKILAFIKEYADDFHHKKEEDVLFQWMRRQGFPTQSGPIVCMMVEHDVGRYHVKTIEEEIAKNNLSDTLSIEIIVNSLIDIASHLENHIFKEDNVLYPMIVGMLNKEGDQEVVKGYFNKISKSDCLNINHHNQKLIAELENKYLNNK